MTIYIDISQLERARSNTGIQRVLKEFLQRMILEKVALEVKVISHNASTNTIELLDNQEIAPFLDDIKHYQFQSRKAIDIQNQKVTGTHIFFDIDSVWSVELKREKLYPKLKANGFLIFNFLHDLIPLVMPEVVHEVTIMHFEPFLDAVYQHSDMVFFNSHSSKRDFLERKEFLKIKRHIPSRVVGLGADFLELSGSFDRNFADGILDKKYILFVGTIEPRKNQKEMIDAFEILAQKYPNLHLVIIGKEGWNVTNLINKIKSHPLKDTQLHWFSNIDDNLLREFYKNAFIVTYLSKYEGYGLPIVESLAFGNVTITSKNSSMLEAGGDFADYILYNTTNEIVDVISLYCDNIALYHAKRNTIKQNFKALSWDKVYGSLSDVLKNYKKANNLQQIQKQKNTKELQFVFISISFESIEATIKAIDKYMSFVKEYIVVTQPKRIEQFKTLSTDKRLTIIDETEILREYKKDFHLRDHQSKNWLLRVSLLNLEMLDDEFIMLDDDNRPLKDIPIEFFISKDGTYNTYYFYNLLEWNHKGTEYDLGQHSTKEVLIDKNYELLSYSSHAPQIINRQILQEVASNFFELGLHQPIDEWSIYFNYAISTYPSLFRQNIFQTLNWPDTPLSWDYSFIPPSYSFENYYERIYTKGLFKEDSSYEKKIAIKEKEIQPHTNSKRLFEQNISMLSQNNMAHGLLSFKKEDFEFYLFGLPYLIVVEESSDIRLKINYKLLNPTEELHEIVIAILLFGKPRTYVKLQALNTESYQEGIVEIPIVSQDLSSILDEYPLPSELLKEGMHNLSFDLIVNKKYIYGTKSPYLTKLMVVDREKMNSYLSHKSAIRKNRLKPKLNINKAQLKERIKSIPFIGWFSRWSNNLLRLNRLAFQQFHQQANIDILLEKIENQQRQIDMLIQKNSNTKSQISKEITTHALRFQERIDEFIAQNAMESEASAPNKTDLQEKTKSFILDDFYLAFENKFRGSREEIEKRYQSYIKYLNSNIKTALDIGCGRGEWVGLLQKNGIQAKGIDLNFAMLNDGLSHGIKNLKKINAFEFFKTCPDNSFDLVTAFHIIEHIPYEELFTFLKEIKRISTPNAVILLETPNPANILVGAFEFYKDPTHLNPLPDDVMRFTVEYMGFVDVKVEKLHSFPQDMKIEEHSQTAQHFNHFFYQERDYLIVAKNGKQATVDNIKKKAKLAFISPLPPQPSGVAYYSAELLVELSKFYEIDIIDINGGVDRSYLDSSLTIRTQKWFESHYNEYHRVLYHFGNSAFHIPMIELIKRFTGVIVLHDFYLSNLLFHAKKLNQNMLYQEHGYQALLNKINYPCNKSILNQSLGVITHSDYSKEILKEWYNDSYTSNWFKIPLLRTPPKNDEVLLTKEMLGLPKDAFVVCCFGLLRPNKKNHELLDAWLNSTLHKNPNCYLIFVGNNQEDTAYGKKLATSTTKQIKITDWVDDITFKSYLSIADIGVQLRSNSTGETSATILDCMNHEVALIINANGSNQELPNDTVIMLEDEFEVNELTKALEILYNNENQEREELSTKAKEYIEKYHQPKECAKLYYDSIEQSYQDRDNHKKLSIQNLNQESFLYSDFTKIGQKQILVDVSTIIRNDLKTGIERVVRSQIVELIKNAPAYIRIEPVYFSFDEGNYLYAREYTFRLLGLGVVGGEHPTDEVVKVNRGDVFYGLDLSAREVQEAKKINLYQHYKSLGVSIVFMVYDLLPITKPHLFPSKMEAIHQQWFDNITSIADLLISISQKVADDITTHTKNPNIPIEALHLGADITKNSNFSSESEALAPNRTPLKPLTFLMVGTVEPRKGHKEVLEAFEKLWKEGLNLHLKIVGKEGWGVEKLIKKLNNHPQLNQKLFYLSFVSDEELEYLYGDSNALIVAGIDEGFGLPLIEGAKHHIPIIARDIKVFKEVAGEYAYYFKDELSTSIKSWIELYKENRHPLSEQIPYMTWKENAIKLLKILEKV